MRGEKQLAFAERGSRDVTLWCQDLGRTRAGMRRFTVINGAWDGTFDPQTGMLTIDHTRAASPVDLLWEGTAPFDHADYNAAIAWLNQQVTQ